MATSFQSADAALNALSPGNVPGVRQAAVSLGLRRVKGRVTTQIDRTSATPSAEPQLSFQVEAGRTYAFRFDFITTCAAAGGIRINLNGGTATASSVAAHYEARTATAVATANVTALNTDFAPAAAAHLGVTITGVVTASNTGPLTLSVGQQSASGTSSILVGSTFEVEDITA